MIKKTIAFLACFSASSAVHAVVECPATPVSVLTAHDGNVYIYLSNGGVGYVNQGTTTHYKETFALATAALLAGRSIVVRYPDGTACTAIHATILGLQLYGQ